MSPDSADPNASLAVEAELWALRRMLRNRGGLPRDLFLVEQYASAYGFCRLALWLHGLRDGDPRYVRLLTLTQLADVRKDSLRRHARALGLAVTSKTGKRDLMLALVEHATPAHLAAIIAGAGIKPGTRN